MTARPVFDDRNMNAAPQHFKWNFCAAARFSAWPPCALRDGAAPGGPDPARGNTAV